MNIPFKKWNNRIGIAMFLVASAVYLLTMERKLSFWDCGEYIVSSSKLGVTHAPGAALFQLIGALWSGLAFGDGSKYAILINAMSALSSALTIMFLFWTITHFARRMFKVNVQNEVQERIETESLTQSQVLIALGSGIVGAAVFMFSDSFWFSAVEGEVYAMASLFTAILVWLACKWEEEKDKKRADKWFLLISLVIGLGTGVHLMVILAIPVACYLYYIKNYKFTIKSFLIANVLTALFLGFVFKILFEAVMTFFGKTEVFVVNNFGMPFNSGTWVAGTVLALFFYFALSYTKKLNWKTVNTLILSVVFMLIGFSSWLVIPIRANANPHMNLNDPDTALGMLDYFNRVQYGDWPTTYGYVYTANFAEDGIEVRPDGNYVFTITGENYVKNKTLRKYVKVSDRKEPVYNKKHVKIFPKMFSPDSDVMENYAALYGFPEFTLNPSFFNDFSDSPESRAQKRQFAEQQFNELMQKKHDRTLKISDLKQNADILDIQPPTFMQQLNYFIDFQLGYMGFRYFMWNFSGKQNDWEGNMEVTKGNWISGIPFIDNPRLGNQSTLPAKFKDNKAHNVYYMLPLLLGIIGFFVQLNRNVVHWWAILSLFLLTSVGIIFYTSVKPFEPRERDYALVSSFYAFAIWVGLGVMGLYFLIQKIKKTELKPSIPIVISIVCLGVPALMGFQNWDDHDRSKREGAYALAYNYLHNLDKNSILFVYGDNDTYPLWGLQETENFRDDVKIVNYTLLNSAWNIDQALRKTYNAPALPSRLKYEDFQMGTNDNIMLVGGNIRTIFTELNRLIREDSELTLDEVMSLPASEIPAYLTDVGYDAQGIQGFYQSIRPFREYMDKDSMTAKEAYEFLMDNKNPLKLALSDYFEYPLGPVNFLPVDKITIPVNKENAVKYGIVSAKDADKMVDEIVIKIDKRQLYKPDLLLISLFAEYNWDRAIYFSGGGISDPVNVFWLSDYLENNGFSYKLIPIRTPFGQGGKIGRSNTEVMYKSFNELEWANYNHPKASFSETDRRYTNTYRNIATRLADDFIEAGEFEKAKEVLDKVMEMIPDENRYDFGTATDRIAQLYKRLGENEKAEKLFEKQKERLQGRIEYYENLPINLRYTISSDLINARSDYSMLIYGQVNTLLEKNDTTAALELFKKEFNPIREKFIYSYQNYKSDGSLNIGEQRNVESQLRFVSELLTIADMIDSVYAENQNEEIYQILTK